MVELSHGEESKQLNLEAALQRTYTITADLTIEEQGTILSCLFVGWPVQCTQTLGSDREGWQFVGQSIQISLLFSSYTFPWHTVLEGVKTKKKLTGAGIGAKF